MNKGNESLMSLMPPYIKESLAKQKTGKIEEIRIKINAPIYVYSGNKEYVLYDETGVIIVKESDIKYILEKATDNSLYAHTEEINQGFITVASGHRIGVGGKAVYENGKLKSICNLSFLNIRCANEIKGVGEKVYNHIYNGKSVHNTLFISPPGCGKTTVLRDVARLLSANSNMKVVIIDERDEIAAKYINKELCDVGKRTFVLSGYSKKDGFSHAIRSLSPTVIICDEIGFENDFLSIKEAMVRGVKVIASVHGSGIEDVKSNEELRAFKIFVVLDRYFAQKIYVKKAGDYIEL